MAIKILFRASHKTDLSLPTFLVRSKRSKESQNKIKRRPRETINMQLRLHG